MSVPIVTCDWNFGGVRQRLVPIGDGRHLHIFRDTPQTQSELTDDLDSEILDSKLLQVFNVGHTHGDGSPGYAFLQGGLGA